MSNRQNTARFTVDFVNKQIIGTETSLNKAKHYGSPEYKELCKLVKAHPNFTIRAKKSTSKKLKATYKHLTFKVIEKYISTLPDAKPLMAEYRHVRQMAKELNLGVYPFTKHWFLNKFRTEDEPLDMAKVMEAIGVVIPDETTTVESSKTIEEITDEEFVAAQIAAVA